MTRGPETITSVTITIDVKGSSFTDEHRCVDFDPDVDGDPTRCFSCGRPEGEHHAKTERSVTWGVGYLLREALRRIDDRGVTAMDNRNLLDINGQTVGRIIIEREEKGS
jgi:DNA-directed RNA polymerase subunit N (RpoN/RPB10)